ncbi:MAG TPA: hypothetical protein VFI77_02025 [Gemmatimonadales bacterium]|nr:hypothetical protein [Gemmatimonadales bacterium]
MSDAHWHLIVNHLPVLGVPFGAALVGVGLLRNQATLQRAGLAILVLAGIAAGVAYLTGEPAEHALETLGSLGNRPESLIEAHEEAALIATVMTGLLALVAGVGLWRLRRGLLGRSWMAGAMVLALATTLALGWVATLGGRISHPEIRSAAPVGTATAPLDD